MLTFSREVDCVWRRNFTFITILYLIQRYGLLVEHIFGLINAVLESPSVIVCFLRYLLAHHLAHFDYRGAYIDNLLSITRLDFSHHTSCWASWVGYVVAGLPLIFSTACTVSSALFVVPHDAEKNPQQSLHFVFLQ